jgi:hypothetical protein
MVDNEELKDLYSSNIVRVINSRRMRWAGHVARMGERRGVYRVLVGKPERRDHLEEPGIDGSIILRLSFRKWDGGTDWIDLAQDRDRWKALM